MSFILPAFRRGIRSSLLAGDVSYAWRIWSLFAEVSLVRAFVASGGPVSESGFRLGRGVPDFGMSLLVVLWSVGFVLILGLGMVKLFIFLRILLYPGSLSYVAGLVVFYMFWMEFIGVALLCLVIWSFLLSGVLLSRLVLVVLFVVLILMFLLLLVSHLLVIMFVFFMMLLLIFLHKVVVFRRDVAVRGWRSWMLEDGKVHPYRWLKPDLVVPAPLLCCDPCLTVDGSGVLSDPDRIDEQFRNAWLPFFCRAGRSVADPSFFDREVGGWLLRLGEFDFPPLLGSESLLCRAA